MKATQQYFPVVPQRYKRYYRKATQQYFPVVPQRYKRYYRKVTEQYFPVVPLLTLWNMVPTSSLWKISHSVAI